MGVGEGAHWFWISVQKIFSSKHTLSSPQGAICKNHLAIKDIVFHLSWDRVPCKKIGLLPSKSRSKWQFNCWKMTVYWYFMNFWSFSHQHVDECSSIILTLCLQQCPYNYTLKTTILTCFNHAQSSVLLFWCVPVFRHAAKASHLFQCLSWLNVAQSLCVEAQNHMSSCHLSFQLCYQFVVSSKWSCLQMYVLRL